MGTCRVGLKNGRSLTWPFIASYYCTHNVEVVCSRVCVCCLGETSLLRAFDKVKMSVNRTATKQSLFVRCSLSNDHRAFHTHGIEMVTQRLHRQLQHVTESPSFPVNLVPGTTVYALCTAYFACCRLHICILGTSMEAMHIVFAGVALGLLSDLLWWTGSR